MSKFEENVRIIAAQVSYLRIQGIVYQALISAIIDRSTDDDPGERRLQINHLLSSVERTLAKTAAEPGAGLSDRAVEEALLIAKHLLLPLAGKPD